MPGQSNVYIGGVENIDGDLHASGSINAKDLVELTSNDNEVQQASTDGSGGYGVALYDAADGDAIAVATVGAKVLINANSGVSGGDLLTSHGGTNAGEVNTADATGDEIVGRATTDPSSGEAEAILVQGGEIN